MRPLSEPLLALAHRKRMAATRVLHALLRYELQTLAQREKRADTCGRARCGVIMK
jgi:hypothetical protein